METLTKEQEEIITLLKEKRKIIITNNLKLLSIYLPITLLLFISLLITSTETITFNNLFAVIILVFASIIPFSATNILNKVVSCAIDIKKVKTGGALESISVNAFDILLPLVLLLLTFTYSYNSLFGILDISTTAGLTVFSLVFLLFFIVHSLYSKSKNK